MSVHVDIVYLPHFCCHSALEFNALHDNQTDGVLALVCSSITSVYRRISEQQTSIVDGIVDLTERRAPAKFLKV